MPNPNQPTVNAIHELKTEIKNLRNELNQLHGSILNERLKATQQALTQNRLLLYTNQLQDELNEDVPTLTDPNCKNCQKCTQHFKTLTEENLKIIKETKIQEALTDLDTKISQIGNTIQKAKGAPCEECHQKLQKKLKRQKRSLQTVVLVEKSEAPDQQSLNIDELVESVLEPLANTVRLKILVNISEGKKSFSQLTQLTGLKGGHLIFHIKKLVDTGLIAQENNKGDYIVTQRGIDIAQKLSNLQPTP
ncbi:MAG: winged helix-turn-helix domain-containing protein [Candidatus Bathyarchaeota archaeon]|nr:winged helix-turn-helix domain-containing protein [Candidatus Bathyarchaeota archaeon]